MPNLARFSILHDPACQGIVELNNLGLNNLSVYAYPSTSNHTASRKLLLSLVRFSKTGVDVRVLVLNIKDIPTWEHTTQLYNSATQHYYQYSRRTKQVTYVRTGALTN
ncbi:hypothetical protein TWF217_008798 [Orbilia oligospora]|nr:hypothetical protein TWF217_008798 [Orbilia oligospora]KAF3269430.1 hypothetical protein TWF128_005659 [Orbilia oligospora]KAF3296665.1 hypothetical protein TWF132_010245 [Orbilia oligospora]